MPVIKYRTNNVYCTEVCRLTGRQFEADALLAELEGVGYIDRSLLDEPDFDPAELLRERAARQRASIADTLARADELDAMADAGIDIDTSLPEGYVDWPDLADYLAAPLAGVTVWVPTTEEERSYGMGDERLALDPALAGARRHLAAVPHEATS